jgi:hypothetical protein
MSSGMTTLTSLLAVLGIGTIVAAAISWRIAISNYRQAWINALRDDIAALLKDLEDLHHVFAFVPLDDGWEASKHEARLKILFSYWRIVLRLNRTEGLHQELRQRLDELMLVRDRVPDRTSVEQAIDLARRILKQEWEVTKYGVFRRPIAFTKRMLGWSGGDRTMNWKRGLLRAWIVIAAVWLFVSTWFTHPVQRLDALDQKVVFVANEKQYEFPDSTPREQLLAFFVAWADKQQGVIKHKLAERRQLTADEFLEQGASSHQLASEIIGNYRPAHHESLLAIWSNTVLAVIAPPIFLLIFAWVFVWIARGFRASDVG